MMVASSVGVGRRCRRQLGQQTRQRLDQLVGRGSRRSRGRQSRVQPTRPQRTTRSSRDETYGAPHGATESPPPPVASGPSSSPSSGRSTSPRSATQLRGTRLRRQRRGVRRRRRSPMGRPTSPAAERAWARCRASVVAAAFAVFNPQPSSLPCSTAGRRPTPRPSARPARRRHRPAAAASSATHRKASSGPTSCWPGPSSRCDRKAGRCTPASRSLAIPDYPLGAVWRMRRHAREFRGDSHIAAWIAAGLRRHRDRPAHASCTGACRCAPTAAPGRGPTSSSTPPTSASSPAAWSPTARFTEAGRAAREAVEVHTDDQMRPAIDALGDDVDELFAILAPWGEAIRAGSRVPGAGPHDLATAAQAQ